MGTHLAPPLVVLPAFALPHEDREVVDPPSGGDSARRRLELRPGRGMMATAA